MFKLKRRSDAYLNLDMRGRVAIRQPTGNQIHISINEPSNEHAEARATATDLQGSGREFPPCER
eukprot:scaffold31028_cov67-Skeletonema_dohrnii-CCMP3373.AAC.1